MIFKSFAHISRHASLAKSLWTSSGNPTTMSQQPAFFVTTGQLQRQHSQVAIRNGPTFSQNQRGGPGAGPNPYAGLAAASNSFSSLSPLSSLDDDRQHELALEMAISRSGPSGHARPRRPSIEARRHLATSAVATSEGRLPGHRRSKRAGSAPAPSRDATPAPEDSVRAPTPPSEETREAPEYFASRVPADEVAEPIAEPAEVAVKADDVSETVQLETPPVSPNVTRDEPAEAALETAPLATEDIVGAPAPDARTLEFNERLAQNIASLPLDQRLVAVVGEYEHMLSSEIVPDTQTYTLILDTVLDVSFNGLARLKSDIHLRNAGRRHGTELLPSVAEAVNDAEAASNVGRYAVDFFMASHAGKRSHIYPAELYSRLLKACPPDRVSQVLEGIPADVLASDAKLASRAIRAYGKIGHLDAALETYEAYKASVGASTPEAMCYVYASLVMAYFYNDMEDHAVRFIEKLYSQQPELTASDEFGRVLGAAIVGFAKNGDFESAWRWIREAGADRAMSDVPVKVVNEVFALLCSQDAPDMALANDMFDYVASQKRMTSKHQSTSMVELRSDFLASAIKARHLDSLFKAIQETHLRRGAWDITTVVRVFDALVQQQDLELRDLAVDLFQAESYTLSSLKTYREEFGEDALVAAVSTLKGADALDARSAMSLLHSAFGQSPRAFANPRSGGIELLETLWAARANGDSSYRDLAASSPAFLLDLVRVHNIWIHSSGDSNSLGSISVPTPLLQRVTDFYTGIVGEVVASSRRELVTDSLADDVTKSLRLISAHDAAEMWQAYVNAPAAAPVQSLDSDNAKLAPEPVVPSPFLELPLVDHEASGRISALTSHKHGLESALELLRDTLFQRRLVEASAVVRLLKRAATDRNRSALTETYELLHRYYPAPVMSVDLMDMWVQIYQSTVRLAAPVAYDLAYDAYNGLLRMNACPDATGYGLLMAHSNNRDEANEAMRLFVEASERGIVMNTFVFNVLLSKLSKARRLKEALDVYSLMEAHGVDKTSFTYGTMINACCRAGSIERAQAFFAEMEASENYEPRIAPFNIMLQYYVYTERSRRLSLETYNRLRARGLTPSAHTYKLLIDMYTTIEPVDLEAADGVLGIIKSDANRATSQHFAALILARGVALRDLEAAKSFYAGLVKNDRVRPDAIIFQALLESYVVNDAVRDTPAVLNEMMRYNVELSAYMTNILIRGWATISLEKSVGVFDYILSRDVAEPSSYESMVRAFLFHGDVTSARNVVDTMASKAFPEAVVNKVASFLAENAARVKSNADALMEQSIFKQESKHSHNLDNEITSS